MSTCRFFTLLRRSSDGKCRPILYTFAISRLVSSQTRHLYYKVGMAKIEKRGNCSLQDYLWKMVITGYKSSHLKRSLALSFTFPFFLVNLLVQASHNNLN